MEGQYAWTLNVDVLVMEELQVQYLDYMALAIRSALLDL